MDELEKTRIYRFHAEFCQCLADASRLMIIAELENGELTVGELAHRLRLPQTSASKHLALMRGRGLVRGRREGVNIYYSLSDPRIYQAIKLMRQVQIEQADQHLSLARKSTELD
jgi:ArsR family transcriptional regulator